MFVRDIEVFGDVVDGIAGERGAECAIQDCHDAGEEDVELLWLPQGSVLSRTDSTVASSTFDQLYGFSGSPSSKLRIVLSACSFLISFSFGGAVTREDILDTFDLVLCRTASSRNGYSGSSHCIVEATLYFLLYFVTPGRLKAQF